MKTEEFTGFWWLPDAPDRRVAGTLRYEGKGYPELDLTEALRGVKDDIAGATILGLSAEAKEVTIEVDFETGRQHVSTARGHSLERQSLAVRQAFVGLHLPTEAEREFTSIAVEFTDLLPWMGWRGLQDKWSAESLEVRYTPPPEVCADLPWGKICLGQGWGTQGDGLSVRSISVTGTFVCERREPASVQVWFSDVVRPLRDFLTFATDRANQVEAVSLWSGTDRERVQLIYSPTSVELPPPVSHSFDFLFTAQSIASEFGERVARWLSLQAELGPALDLHFAARYRPSTHLENKFLNEAAAAEAYHRRRFPLDQATRDAYRERVQRIVEASAPEERGWLKWRLKYGYEPSFADRIRDLFDRAKEVLQTWLGDPSAFASRIAAARNGLVHRDPDDIEAIPDGRSMLDMAEDLALIFIVCVLRDLGFDNATIRTMLEHTDRWRFMTFRKHGWSD